MVDSLEGGDGLVTNQFDFGLGRRTAISSTADVLAATAVLFDEVSEKFKYLVKVVKVDPFGKLELPTIVNFKEGGDGSLFEKDASSEIALSGDGGTLVIATTKATRPGQPVPQASTVEVFKWDEGSNDWPNGPSAIPYIGDAGGGGYYFAWWFAGILERRW